MKTLFRFIWMLAASAVLFSCGRTGKVKFDSTGKINQLLIVMDDRDWKGALGDTVRKHFAADVMVLPQREPIFSINQIPPEVYDENFFILRNILMIKRGENRGVRFKKDPYAQPQLVVEVEGKNLADISAILHKEAPRIIDSFKMNEIRLLQSRFKKKDLVDVSQIEKELGITIEIPNTFQKIVAKDGFFWYREDMPLGSKNILLYSVPMEKPEDLERIAARLPQIRDSIGKKYIPGPLPHTWMVTEKTFGPVQKKVNLNGVTAIESRGLWEMENDYMGGPYLSYIIPLPRRKRAVIAEGFIYLPSDEKRNLLTELEAILRTIRPVDQGA
ncbi:MAG: DUF4837 family protein [Chlorobi bacterium]|nr:DUF4837 family protein [Chlorobiota bacterium]